MATPTVGESVVRIPLHSKGGAVVAYALVDKADAHLAVFRWRDDGDGYARRSWWESGKTKSVSMHREILGLTKGDGKIADHVNRDRLDNRRSNLRITDQAGNSQNRQHKGFSGIRGVAWSTKVGMWQATVTCRGVVHWLGYFQDAEDAGAAAARKRKELGMECPESVRWERRRRAKDGY